MYSNKRKQAYTHNTEGIAILKANTFGIVRISFEPAYYYKDVTPLGLLDSINAV